MSKCLYLPSHFIWRVCMFALGLKMLQTSRNCVSHSCVVLTFFGLLTGSSVANVVQVYYESDARTDTTACASWLWIKVTLCFVGCNCAECEAFWVSCVDPDVVKNLYPFPMFIRSCRLSQSVSVCFTGTSFFADSKLVPLTHFSMQEQADSEGHCPAVLWVKSTPSYAPLWSCLWQRVTGWVQLSTNVCWTLVGVSKSKSILIAQWNMQKE